MENSFLLEVARALYQQHGDALSRLCIVLPTRRAGLFLREAIAQSCRQTIWAPRIMAEQDFIQSCTSWQFPEQLELVFELYEAYNRCMAGTAGWQPEAFERFYPWGEMLLRDFDEVDKYVVDADKLFVNVRDLRNIEQFFGPDEEVLSLLSNFWGSVQRSVAFAKSQENPSLAESFASIWEKLPEVYREFRSALLNTGRASTGMAYRWLAEALNAGDAGAVPYEHVVFAGFNALTTAEQQIIGKLLEQGRAQLFWDADAYFLPESPNGPSNPIGEVAARSLLAHHERWKNKGSTLIVHPKGPVRHIGVAGVPLGMGQVQYAGQLLREAALRPEQLRQHAVVLADENLLFPLLHALPEQANQVNITMGMPLRLTHIYQFFAAAAQLIRSLMPDGPLRFPHTEVLSLLQHPLCLSVAPEPAVALSQHIAAHNLVFITPEELKKHTAGNTFLNRLFSIPTSLPEAFAYTEYLFDTLFLEAEARGGAPDTEYVYHLNLAYNQLKTILQRYNTPLSVKAFFTLLRDTLRRVRIPFEGEPLAGLQVMGMLETRALDFEHLYILGVNEGILPDVSVNQSFIPYTLRRAFRLPTPEEKDAIFAHHFFRLLMRARSVQVVYDNDVSGNNKSGEASRFIHLLKYFGEQAGYAVAQQQVQLSNTLPPLQNLRIPAGAEIRAAILKRFRNGVSATALSAWMTCPLRFYFHYVANIREPETVNEDMDPRVLGELVHAVLEQLYQPLLNQELTADKILALRAQIEELLRKAFAEKDLGRDEELLGKNRLWFDIAKTLCTRALEEDAKHAPFTVLELETKTAAKGIMVEGEPLHFSGVLDRVIRLKNGQLMITDYKTGQVSLAADTDPEKCFDREHWRKQYSQKSKGLKEGLQGFMYAWMYRQAHPETELLRVAFYPLRNIRQQGAAMLLGGEPVPQAMQAEISQRLSDLLTQILHADFVQTDDVQYCRQCPYNTICNRS